MSLFALSYEYQRSIDRTWEDFSTLSRAQTETTREEVESERHKSVLHVGNQGETYEQNQTQNAITRQVEGGSGLMQCDTKAWARFLDGKRKQ